MRLVGLQHSEAGFGVVMGKRCSVDVDPGVLAGKSLAAKCGFPQFVMLIQPRSNQPLAERIKIYPRRIMVNGQCSMADFCAHVVRFFFATRLSTAELWLDVSAR